MKSITIATPTALLASSALANSLQLKYYKDVDAKGYLLAATSNIRDNVNATCLTGGEMKSVKLDSGDGDSEQICIYTYGSEECGAQSFTQRYQIEAGRYDGQTFNLEGSQAQGYSVVEDLGECKDIPNGSDDSKNGEIVKVNPTAIVTVAASITARGIVNGAVTAQPAQTFPACSVTAQGQVAACSNA